jgi:glycosyltransferase involved in cell wall biosynthesis
MYTEKRIFFLLDSLIYVKEQIPDFEMIFIGSGTDAILIEDMAQKYPWVHYLGPKFNNEKVPYFALSHLFLMPGLVGLAILDCIAMGLPLITMKNSLHSPEIEYLHTGENGIMVDSSGDSKIYAQAVIDLLKDENERLRLVEGCKASRSKYSIENMANNYANGIQLALDI